MILFNVIFLKKIKNAIPKEELEMAESENKNPFFRAVSYIFVYWFISLVFGTMFYITVVFGKALLKVLGL